MIKNNTYKTKQLLIAILKSLKYNLKNDLEFQLSKTNTCNLKYI